LNKTLQKKYLDCHVHNQEGMLYLSDHYPVEVTIDP
jgi:endonuclease/exonuclease/phosphatase family metal-dependent hydrolase